MIESSMQHDVLRWIPNASESRQMSAAAAPPDESIPRAPRLDCPGQNSRDGRLLPGKVEIRQERLLHAVPCRSEAVLMLVWVHSGQQASA